MESRIPMLSSSGMMERPQRPPRRGSTMLPRRNSTMAVGAPPRPPRSVRSLCVTRASSPQPTARLSSKRLSTGSSSKNSISGSSESALSLSSQATSIHDEVEPCAKQPPAQEKPEIVNLPRDLDDRPVLPVPANEVAEIYASVRNLIADLRRDMGSRPETPRPSAPHANDDVKTWLSDPRHAPMDADTPLVSTVSLSRRSSASSYSSTSSFVPTPTSSPGRSALPRLITSKPSLAPSCKEPLATHSELAQMQQRIDDLQDENALLRAQLSLLSEQIVSRPVASPNLTQLLVPRVPPVC